MRKLQKADSWYNVQQSGNPDDGSVTSMESGRTSVRSEMSALHLHHIEKDSRMGNHMVDPEETRAFSSYINALFPGDETLKVHLPLDVDGDDLFKKQNDGLILVKLVNNIKEGTIAEGEIHKGKKITVFQKAENVVKVLDGAKRLGCIMVNIGAKDIMDGRYVTVNGLMIWMLFP
jgi:hypothetical protein